MLSRHAWKSIAIALFVLLLISTWVAYESISYAQTAPKGDIRTIDDCIAWQGSRLQWQSFSVNGQTYLMASRPGAGLMPSGQAVYLFDRSGRLIDWTSDSGDDSRFQNAWNWNAAIPTFQTVTESQARAFSPSPAPPEKSLPAIRSSTKF